nr:hypothetical protein [uncultured Carboxylicivirga sp.]
MRFLINVGVLLLFFSCKAILDPIAETFSNAIITYAQQDTCKKILTAKIIYYRMQTGEFPVSIKELDSVNISVEEYKIALKLMFRKESDLSDSLKYNFQNTWNCECPKQIDSISLKAYNSDSLDMFSRIIKYSPDTTYALISTNRRLLFECDTLSRMKLIKLDIQPYDKDGKEIEYLRKGKSSRKIKNGS